ncbi:MAG: hypothetical protein J0I42_14935 [Bosea sp.]|uniref:hypothetical protein n=1 Tax=Bosea sp. (in: a-proteobacteria) TaxID=1871050 RepID=UPI001AC767D4|nr:hypothetical protein [Bosea sp. (in: a-proteobacteria)]MBN9453241.1 hypothetical protein [Bosea sp. (in: a-proteobacteria)]
MNAFAIAIPGYLGPVDDLSSRIEAIGEDEIPTQWTPEHVQNRLIEAFRLVRRNPRVGPRVNANGWPEYLREFSDLTDMIEDEDLAELRKKITAAEATRMNEALSWPMQYLEGKPLAADALMTWAYAIAIKRDMAALLAHRKKRAMALAAEMMERHNAPPHLDPDGAVKDTRDPAVLQAYATRLEIAREVAKITNEALSSAPVPTHAQIRSNAQASFRAQCREAGCLPLVVKPHEAMPGKCLSRTNLDRQRKVAAAEISSRLKRSGRTIK